MQRQRRFTIVGLMAIVLMASFGLAALRTASATWAGAVYLVVRAVFLLAIVGAVCRGPAERAWWLGFALFGLAFLRGVFWYGFGGFSLPTTELLQMLRPESLKPARGDMFNEGYGYYLEIGQCLLSLISATIGGFLARYLFAPPGPDVALTEARRDDRHRPAWAAWLKFTALGLVPLAALAGLVVLGVRSDPALWVSVVYMLTWLLLGTALLGFACGRGKRRMIWLGAALFGLGYMVLNVRSQQFEEVNYARMVAEQLLDSFRSFLPPVVSGYPAKTAALAAENLRIRKALDQPVPMRFADGASLEQVLEHVRTETQTADGRKILIHVDPIGLLEAEKTMHSSITIDIEGRPLFATLRLALSQLGLIAFIDDGILKITADANEDVPPTIDYYLLLGHCVLALVAAGLGALLVPLVSASAADPALTDQPGTASQ